MVAVVTSNLRLAKAPGNFALSKKESGLAGRVSILHLHSLSARELSRHYQLNPTSKRVLMKSPESLAKLWVNERQSHFESLFGKQAGVCIFNELIFSNVPQYTCGNRIYLLPERHCLCRLYASWWQRYPPLHPRYPPQVSG